MDRVLNYQNNIMSNSFYYFFSSTPQVLGAILALFGVFVLFKIEIIKAHLIGIGKSIIKDKGTYLSDTFELTDNTILKDKAPKHDPQIIDLKMSIIKNDIKGLKSIIDKLDKELFSSYQKNYCETYESLKSLITCTVFWSVYTVILIIGCLTILSQGCYFLDHYYLVYYTKMIIIVLICACFIGLIKILRKSLDFS